MQAQETIITAALKKRIQDLDLIDTGEMLRQTRCIITKSATGYSIGIDSTEYFKYVDGNFDIVDFVFSLPHIVEALQDIAVGTIVSELN